MRARPWIPFAALLLLSPVSGLAEQVSEASGRMVFPITMPDDLVDDAYSASRPGPHEPILLLLLSHFDSIPKAAELEDFEPGLEDKLRAIVLDERVIQLARLRAIAVLGEIGGDESFELVSRLALDPEAMPRLRIQAFWAVGHLFEGRPGREAVLAKGLEETDHGFRLHAVLSLARIGSEEAQALIDSHRMAERHLAVRKVLRELAVQEREGRVIPPEGLSRYRQVPSERIGPVERPKSTENIEEVSR